VVPLGTVEATGVARGGPEAERPGGDGRAAPLGGGAPGLGVLDGDRHCRLGGRHGGAGDSNGGWVSLTRGMRRAGAFGRRGSGDIGEGRGWDGRRRNRRRVLRGVAGGGGRRLMKGREERGRRPGWAASPTGVFHLCSPVCCGGRYRAYYFALSDCRLAGDFQRGFTSGPVLC
jgi:hypothetical protein